MGFNIKAHQNSTECLLQNPDDLTLLLRQANPALSLLLSTLACGFPFHFAVQMSGEIPLPGGETHTHCQLFFLWLWLTGSSKCL